MSSIGFIGCGNMGGTLALAAAKAAENNSFDGEIFVSNYNKEKAECIIKQADSKNINESSNEEIAEKCKYIVLGVKPQVLANVLNSIKDILAGRSDRFILISMAAGITTDFVCKAAGGDYPVIRIMPNTPAMLGSGVILHCENAFVSTDEIDEFVKAFSEAGVVDEISESIIDAASAVSGCGPAFVYMFIEALADGGVKCGLTREKAMKYAAQTVLGSAEMVMNTGKHPGQLKDEVCSPSGSTIAGVGILEDKAFRSAAIEAVEAAFKRTKELSGD